MERVENGESGELREWRMEVENGSGEWKWRMERVENGRESVARLFHVALNLRVCVAFVRGESGKSGRMGRVETHRRLSGEAHPPSQPHLNPWHRNSLPLSPRVSEARHLWTQLCLPRGPALSRIESLVQYSVQYPSTSKKPSLNKCATSL